MLKSIGKILHERHLAIFMEFSKNVTLFEALYFISNKELVQKLAKSKNVDRNSHEFFNSWHSKNTGRKNNNVEQHQKILFNNSEGGYELFC